MGELQIQFQELSSDQLNKLKNYLSAQGRNLDSAIESYLTNLLNIIEPNLSDVGKCPNCFVNQRKDNTLKGLPVSEAEKLGFVEISNDGRHFFDESETYFVLCPQCGWWGWSEKSTIEQWKAKG